MIQTLMVNWDLLHKKPLLKCPSKNVINENGEATTEKAIVNAFIQARTGSLRLPNKIYRELNGISILSHVVNKALSASLIDKVVVMSPKPLESMPEGALAFVFNGDESDVLSRYYAALKKHPCDYIVRLTADCPMLDPYLIDFIIHHAIKMKADYCSNVVVLTFPDGVDVEVISAKTLIMLNERAQSKFDREHVTMYIRDNEQNVCSFLKIVSIESEKDFSNIKISVDNENDFNHVREISKCMK